MNTLGSFVFELCCGKTDRQTDIQTNKQTDSKILPTPTDRVGVGNKNHNFYSHNGERVRVSNATRSNEECALRSATQQTIGSDTVALYQPRFLIEMRHGSSVSIASQAGATALNETVQTLMTLAAVQQPPSHKHLMKLFPITTVHQTKAYHS